MTDRDESDGDQYLWDGSGPPDPEVARLEELLSPLRHRDPLRAPAAPERRRRGGVMRWAVLAAAAAALLAAGAGVWRIAGGGGRVRGPGRSDRAIVAVAPADAGVPPLLAATEPEGACDTEGTAGRGLRFAALAGEPSCNGEAAPSGWLPVGVWLETGAGDRAQVQVAGIGEVELAPGSRLRLLATSATEQRFELAHGGLHASVTAPPRMFLVETEAAVAVDLGCEYTLEVADDGSGTLRVLGGYVSLERDGRESLVPAGSACEMRPGVGPGTPYSEQASENLRAALRRLDFDSAHAAGALAVVLAEAGPPDTITLWHLLLRFEGQQRGAVYDRLASLSRPPPRATREAVLAGDTEALADWRELLEVQWMGDAWGPLRKAGGAKKAEGGK